MFKIRSPFIILFVLALAFTVFSFSQNENSKSFASSNDKTIAENFLVFLSKDPSNTKAAKSSLQLIKENWKKEYIPVTVETIGWAHNSPYTADLIKILEEKTGQNFNYDIDKWHHWMWNQEIGTADFYPDFKSKLYRTIDPRFGKYFSKDREMLIRLDEVRWGGVRQDGIPPLRNPKMIQAKEAKYLDDNDVVFGLSINGDARAYPKRILAWHEMFTDTVGGKRVAGVYCTLCGSMILYETEVKGVQYDIGTSGFLYRSNKLMYDKKTQSLWSTLLGKPVIGPLVGKGIVLPKLSVVTSTWGEWRARHPETKVLSLDTGYSRDYSEGNAYKSYFATDKLMFKVPKLDKRLKNKDEIVGLVFTEAPNKALAIYEGFLRKNPIYQSSLGKKEFVILTDSSGANRVYDSMGIKFKSWDQKYKAVDDKGITWKLSEDSLTSSDGRKLYRAPSHRAFWFGWVSAYPHTRLIH